MAIPTFERFFRDAAGIHVDKDDLKRYNEFVEHKISDLFMRGVAVAKANDRDILEPWDCPITAGLQVTMHEFEKMEEEIELAPILERLAYLPQLEVELSEEAREQLPLIAGGLSVALARALQIIDPEAGHPRTADWERAFRLFDLLI